MTERPVNIRILVLDDEKDVRETAPQLGADLPIPAEIWTAATVTEAATEKDAVSHRAETVLTFRIRKK